MSAAIDAGFVREALRRRHPSQEYALFFEVADATGARHRRWADAVAMSLWPSRGLVLDGFEIKVSRYDWLREKAAPEKAETIARYCDRWWIVSPHQVVEEGELPDAWGHQVVYPDGDIMIAKHAVRNSEPAPIDRIFLASLLRSAGKVDSDLIARRVEAEVKRRREDDEKDLEYRIERARGRDKMAGEHLAKIEAALKAGGVDTDLEWTSSDELAAAVAVVVKAKLFSSYSGLPELHASMRTVAGELLPKLEETLTALGVALPDPKGSLLSRQIRRHRKKP
jgi:hypothetical protein